MANDVAFRFGINNKLNRRDVPAEHRPPFVEHCPPLAEHRLSLTSR
ncbi:MAG: hypothetical protein LBL62_05145 [Planctomycetaceae bacterium]|nr:hypothetical protein [Planctomycetaceae bacterium]